jgi:hypothetical protein
MAKLTFFEGERKGEISDRRDGPGIDQEGMGDGAGEEGLGS